ncbi:MAG TPA: trypsin-like peptidase domain-containing protein [Verrucomicrobiales bacterium]|jgi:S1-C subfamily serine protease|nr:trypsin-like peptidase domain-containing protein [Verrucomicrobiales bacterium]
MTPGLSRADGDKPADAPKKEEPKKEEPKKEEPKKEEAKPETDKKPPKFEEQKSEKPKTEETPKEEPKAAPGQKPKKYSEQKSEQTPKDEAKEEPKGPAPQDKYSRETPEILKSWEPALDDARRATVQLTREKKDIAYGCSVHEDGYILTKASEVLDKKGAILPGIEARFPEGLRMPVKLVDIHRPYDLALLKVDARGLRTMPWDEKADPAPGSFIAAATPLRLPAAVGVVSVAPRNMDESQKGWLGVRLDEAGKDGVKILEVTANSPASKAGFVSDDIIKTIDGKSVSTIEEFKSTIATLRPYQSVKIVVKREKGDRELNPTLASRPSSLGALAEDPRNMMSGTLSKNRRGYPDALQHDMVLEPNEVGGPIVDLKGHVVGINIARSGRIECIAIPSKTIKGLLTKVGEGKLYHPELDALRDERKNAETALERIKRDVEHLNQLIHDAESPVTDEAGDKEKKK